MEFFNKKEEVIDFQLTQYGKYLLSLGKLKPVYYAFYDDGIVYDSNFMGFDESHNDANPRIQEQTPNVKPFHNFHSFEDDLKRAIEAKNSGNEALAQQMLQQTADKSQIMTTPLAQSDLGSDKMPAWDISLLSGRILTGSTTETLTLSGSNAILNIPQIEVEVKYTINIKDEASNISQDVIDAVNRGELDGVPQTILEQILGTNTGFDDASYNIQVYDDGTFFEVNQDDLIVQVMEDNVAYSNDNFEIEIFSISDVQPPGGGTSTVKKVEQLRFLVEPEMIIDDILYDEEEINRNPIPNIDGSFADYYFDIETDDQIEASFICNKIKNGDRDQYRFARNDFECPDIKPNYQFLDPYAAKSADDECGSE